MEIFVNKKNRQFIVKKTVKGMNMDYKTPINKSSRINLKLMDSTGNSVELDGMQVKALIHLLNRGNALKECSITSRKKS